MKILLTERHVSEETPIALTNAGFEVFSPKEEIEGVHEFDRTALLATIKDVQPDILVCGFKFKLDKELLDLAPIKEIFTRTTGYDHIDLEYCKEKGIEVINLKGEELGEVVATAEWTFLNMGMLLRKTNHELKGKTLGIIGYGRLGKMMEKYARAFQMKVLHYDKNDHHFDGLMSNLDYLLADSDIVSLHITADEENRNFMNSERFAQMKRGGWFINSSRDWLVDSDALAWAKKNILTDEWSDFPEHRGGKTIESSKKTETILVNKLIQWKKQQL